MIELSLDALVDQYNRAYYDKQNAHKNYHEALSRKDISAQTRHGIEYFVAHDECEKAHKELKDNFCQVVKEDKI